MSSQETGTDLASHVKLTAKGLSATERSLLEGIVNFSLRDRRQRAVHIAVLPDGQEIDADVVLVDAQHQPSRSWAEKQPWLAGKAVVWIDAHTAVPAGHTTMRRPVQWAALPVLLARAMDLKASVQAQEDARAQTQLQSSLPTHRDCVQAAQPFVIVSAPFFSH